MIVEVRSVTVEGQPLGKVFRISEGGRLAWERPGQPLVVFKIGQPLVDVTEFIANSCRNIPAMVRYTFDNPRERT